MREFQCLLLAAASKGEKTKGRTYIGYIASSHIAIAESCSAVYIGAISSCQHST